MNELTSKKWRTAVREALPEEYKGISIEFNEKLFDFGNELAIAAATNLLTETVSREKWPKDWWEAVKERWFPAFLLSRWPVKYQRIDIEAVYPKCSLEDPILKAVSGRV